MKPREVAKLDATLNEVLCLEKSFSIPSLLETWKIKLDQIIWFTYIAVDLLYTGKAVSSYSEIIQGIKSANCWSGSEHMESCS